jgi:hypothetical protein
MRACARVRVRIDVQVEHTSAQKCCAQSCTRMHTHAHACTFMHTHAHSCTRMHIHAHACTFMHTHAHSCTLMHISHAHTHYKHTHTDTHTRCWRSTLRSGWCQKRRHTHTHTHTPDAGGVHCATGGNLYIKKTDAGAAGAELK